jgi:hypothetical protein
MPSIDDHPLVRKISHPCWIKRTHNVGQVIRWIRIDRHIMQVLTFVCIMTIPSKSTISGVTPHLLTLMATICSTSAIVVVVKSEELELFSVERQLISCQ